MKKLKEPRVLTRIGEESRRNRTDKLTSRQIDGIIKAARKSAKLIKREKDRGEP